MPASRAVAKSSPRLGAADRSATHPGATLTRCSPSICPLVSSGTGVGLLSAVVGETNGLGATVVDVATGAGAALVIDGGAEVVDPDASTNGAERVDPAQPAT